MIPVIAYPALLRLHTSVSDLSRRDGWLLGFIFSFFFFIFSFSFPFCASWKEAARLVLFPLLSADFIHYSVLHLVSKHVIIMAVSCYFFMGCLTPDVAVSMMNSLY